DRAGRGVAHAARVVRVDRGHEIVVHVERDARMARPARNLPPGREPPLGDGVLVEAGDRVHFVAAQGAGDSRVVDVAAAPLLHAVVVDAGRQLEPSARGARGPRPLQVGAAEAPVDIDDASRRRRRGAAEREELPDAAIAEVSARTQRVARVDALSPREADLPVVDALAGVVRDRAWTGLRWMLEIGTVPS